MKRQDSWTPMAASLVVIELQQRCDRQGWHWDLILSRAGKEGTYKRTWDNKAGRLSSDQAVDLSEWAQKSVYDALVAWGGVQEVLQT